MEKEEKENQTVVDNNSNEIPIVSEDAENPLQPYQPFGSKKFQISVFLGVSGLMFCSGIAWQTVRPIRKDFKKSNFPPETKAFLKREILRVIAGGTLITIAYGFLGYFIVTRFESVSSIQYRMRDEIIVNILLTPLYRWMKLDNWLNRGYLKIIYFVLLMELNILRLLIIQGK